MDDPNIAQVMNASLTAMCAVHGNGIRVYVSVGLSQGKWDKTRLLLLDESGIKGYHDINAKIVSVAGHPNKFELAAMASNGAIGIATNDDVQFEFIDSAGTGKNRYGSLKSIRYIGDTLFVCGDLQQIYKRTDDEWQRYDFGLRLNDTRLIGRSLNDIAGIEPESIYTVGDRGVIYRLENNHWLDCVSPVNVNLEQIIIAENGTLWICGSNGVIVCGYYDSWEVIATGGHKNETFWGICEYKGDIFVCSSLGLYRLDKTDLIDVVLPGLIGQPFRLVTDSDYLWLLGFNDLMRFDGTEWIHVSWQSKMQS
ncbi:MAG: hypothetical protein AB2792_00030 [Candidatus Thiodiazotropha sp.]